MYYSEVMAEDVSTAAEVFAFDIHRQKYGDDQGSNDCHLYTTHLAVFATSSHFLHSHLLPFFHVKRRFNPVGIFWLLLTCPHFNGS